MPPSWASRENDRAPRTTPTLLDVSPRRYPERCAKLYFRC